MKHTTYILCLLLTLFSCQGGGKTAVVTGESIELTYAENLKLTKADGYVQAVLRNPWDTAVVLQTYLLIPKESPMPESLPRGVVIRTPLQHSLVYSSVHCGLIQELGKVESISGVCDKQYIKLPYIQEGLVKGTVADCGNNATPNIEAIIQLNPDAILLSPYQNSGDYGKVGKLNIPIVQCADYMETSALGRAEWMRFYGLLFGCEQEADELFAATANRYNALKDKVKDSAVRPEVLSDTRYGQIWYVPGASSTTGRIYRDAAAANVFDYLEQGGSAALSPEQVLDKAHDADTWLIKYNQPEDMTLRQLASDADIYTQFKAFKTGNVWGCNTGITNYYEEAPYHPDRTLEDLIRIFHPEALEPGEMHYYKQLQP